MAPELSKVVQNVTFALLALAAIAVEISANDGRDVLQSVGLAMLWIGLAAILARVVPKPVEHRRNPPLWVFLVVLTLAVLPFGLEPFRRSWMGNGYPLEIQMVSGLRNVGLGLAAFGAWLLCLRLACVVSLFLILFAASMTNHPAVLVVLGLYTAVGSVWLMLVYWSGLRWFFVEVDRSVSIEVEAKGSRVPWFGVTLLGLLLLASISVMIIGPKRVSYTLGEWLPTSGGTGETDPFARYGIGDGPEEVAGDDAKAAGMVETDKMIEDNKNSLIDAVSDMYGPPHKPRKDQEKMVAAGVAEVIQFHGKLPDNRRPSRDFDTSRRGPKGDKKPTSQAARGLFEVEGRTPLHIRLVAYDTYYYEEKRWIESRKPMTNLIEAEGDDWMKPGFLKEGDWYCSDERHRLKSADMKSNLVPTPSLMTRFRINQVDRPSYYEWDYDGVIALAGRKRTPPGVVVNTDCRTVDYSRLPETAFQSNPSTPGHMPTLIDLPEAMRSEVQNLANEWVKNLPRGWPQIQAIQTKLRTEYAVDKEAVAPSDHPAPVLWFLTESHRGPDYLFATAFSLMVRSLGYSSRVCLGYYASPAAFDAETGHTPVKWQDLHFWPEILLQDGHWLVVEPTAGYEVLAPKIPLKERIYIALTAFKNWVWHNVTALSILMIVWLILWFRRRVIVDYLSVRFWQLFPRRSWHGQVRQVVAILERRGKWQGQPRPRQQTSFAWLQETPAKFCNTDLTHIAKIAEWAAYAPDLKPPWSEGEIQAACQNVLRQCRLSQWHNPLLASLNGVPQ